MDMCRLTSDALEWEVMHSIHAKQLRFIVDFSLFELEQQTIKENELVNEAMQDTVRTRLRC